MSDNIPPTDKKSEIKGTGTWNMQPIMALSANGTSTYSFRLHVRIAIVDTTYDLAKWRTALANRDYAMIVKLIQNLVANKNNRLPPLKDEVCDVLNELATEYGGSNPGDVWWTLRAYADYNSDRNQSGPFIEFEYELPLQDRGEEESVDGYFAHNGPRPQTIDQTSDGGFRKALKLP